MYYLIPPISPATRIYDSILFWHTRFMRRRLNLPVHPPKHVHYHEDNWFFPALRMRKPLEHDVFERRVY